MRLLRLLRLAMQAERLHLSRVSRGYGIQAGLAAAAALFGLMLMFMLHVAAFAALARDQGPVWAALIVAFADLVLLAIFGFLARRRPHDPIELEALRVREDAMAQVRDGASRALVLVPLLRSQNAKKGLLGAALTAVAMGLMSRR
jgi:hypothetical protein